MHTEVFRVASVAATGLVFWQWVTFFLETPEPWDAPAYPLFYLCSLGLCAAFGYFLPSSPWRWALIIILTQLPVMVLHTGRVDPFMAVGVAVLALQLLPAMLVVAAASRLRSWKSSS